jgi:hypothetical protein
VSRPRETAQTYPVRVVSAVSVCRCGAFYLPDEDGMKAHQVVFGHMPTDREAS